MQIKQLAIWPIKCENNEILYKDEKGLTVGEKKCRKLKFFQIFKISLSIN